MFGETIAKERLDLAEIFKIFLLGRIFLNKGSTDPNTDIEFTDW
jgi:hypothetical protein